MNLPLPSRIAAGLSRPCTNLCLLFDRGFDQWTDEWKRVEARGDSEDGRLRFLRGFAEDFKTRKPADFDARQNRRRRALEALGARLLPARTRSRLVIGLGLPHPTETGLLLDRLTGSPYLPGTSVKGVLRSAARWVAAGELEVVEDASAASFWKAHRDRLFGPALSPGVTTAKGELVVFDALPQQWPTLEVDVLTPHFTKYYGDENETPADWHAPVPVPFLTVGECTPFLFALASRNPEREGEDLERTEALLDTVFRDLGLGGKTAAGYGLFAPDELEEVVPVGPVVWRQAVVQWKPNESVLEATAEAGTAHCKGEAARAVLDTLDPASHQRLTGKVPAGDGKKAKKKKKKKRKPLRRDVEVIPKGSTHFELVAIRGEARGTGDG